MDQDEILSLLQQRKTPSSIDVGPKINIPSLYYNFDSLINSNQNASHSFLMQLMDMKNLIGLTLPNISDNMQEEKSDFDDRENLNNDDDAGEEKNDFSERSRVIGPAERLNTEQVKLEMVSDDQMSVIIRDQEELRDKSLNREESTRKTKEPVERKKTVKRGYFEGIDEDTSLLEKYSHYFEGRTKLNVHSEYTLNNRYIFLNEIRALFSKLNFKMETGKTCDDKGSDDGFIPLSHQLLVQRYLNTYSPYRGLLLFHGLGSGKTCSSIGIIEGMKHDKKVFIMTPASLQKNYKTQMKFCGDQIFRDKNFWVRYTVPRSNDNTKEGKSTILTLMKITGLTKRQLYRLKNIYLVDETRDEPNYSTFSKTEQLEISRQIEFMISTKYNYISYNGITEKMWKTKYKTSETTNPFTNSIVVIDEAHNFVSRIINKLNIKKTSVSTMIYESLMSAENCKIVMLSGTPMINYPCEMGVMFNIIGGYNFCITLQIRSDERESSKNADKMSKTYIRSLFDSDYNVDYIEFDSSKKNVIKVVRNPYNFVNKGNHVVFDNSRGNISLRRFQHNVEEVFLKDGYKIINSKIEKFEKFPQTEEKFNEYFIGEGDEFVNKIRFQNKISGMVSYLGDRKEMMPDIVVPDNYDETGEDIFIERIPMNDYVLSKYNEIRLVERKKEDQMARRSKKNNVDSTTSTYRVFSRSACNFVFPENIQKPQLRGKNDVDIVDEDELDGLTDEERINHIDGKYDESDMHSVEEKNEVNEYRQEIEKALEKLSENRDKVFNSDIQFLVNKNMINKNNQPTNYDILNSLSKYSPKFYSILKNLITENNNVCNLLYSTFRTMEGIGIFKMILEYYGYTELRVVKDSNQDFRLSTENPYYKDDDFIGKRRYFSLYTGTESIEEKEIIRNIYNNNFDNVPTIIKQELERIFGNEITNLHGEIINLLMISASGAEGIDLKNVRNVHIVEPYWHPVRIEQVIGRARRICSHSSLPKEEQDVKVYMYLMIHNKELLREKREEYIQLLSFDKDRKTGKLATTDESLFNIMKRKKRLSDEILGALKESAIDCLINYENKDKCMHVKFSSQVISKIKYTDEGRRTNEQDSQNNSTEEIPLYVKTLILRNKKDGKEYGQRQFAVDEETGIAYDIPKHNGPKIRMGYMVQEGDKFYFSSTPELY